MHACTCTGQDELNKIRHSRSTALHDIVLQLKYIYINSRNIKYLLKSLINLLLAGVDIPYTPASRLTFVSKQ